MRRRDTYNAGAHKVFEVVEFDVPWCHTRYQKRYSVITNATRVIPRLASTISGRSKTERQTTDQRDQVKQTRVSDGTEMIHIVKP